MMLRDDLIALLSPALERLLDGSGQKRCDVASPEKKIGAFHRNRIHGITEEERAASTRLAIVGRNCILPLVEALKLAKASLPEHAHAGSSCWEQCEASAAARAALALVAQQVEMLKA